MAHVSAVFRPFFAQAWAHNDWFFAIATDRATRWHALGAPRLAKEAFRARNSCLKFCKHLSNRPRLGHANPHSGAVRPFPGRFLQNFRHDFLARNASFAHLGAPRACQSVALSVKLTKIRHSGRMFGRQTTPKTAEMWVRRQKIDPNRKLCLKS